MTAPRDIGHSALLVVESIMREPASSSRWLGAIRFGGHLLHVALEFRDDLGVVVLSEVPWLLATHPPSQNAVVQLIARVQAGEQVRLPVDLSATVRDGVLPFRLPVPDVVDPVTLAAEVARVRLEVQSIKRDGSRPTHISAQILLDGSPLSFELELYEEANAVPVIRWLSRPPPVLTEAQYFAIRHVLLSSTV